MSKILVGMSKLTLNLPMRWSDVDGYGHVNNAKMLTLLEEARIMAFWGGSPDPSHHVPESAMFSGGIGSDANTLIVRQEIEYVRPLPYTRAPVRIDLWVSRIGGASLDVGYEVYDDAGRVAARAVTVIVIVDAQEQRPRRLRDAEKEGWEKWHDDPPAMRRR